MSIEITPIPTGIANCYLLKSGDNYCLVDTGFAKKRTELLQSLERTGCKPGNLKLVVITHADSDHTGNCNHLRRNYGAQIAMHHAEVETAESGDAFRSRKFKNGISRMISRLILSFVKLKQADRLTPDLIVKDGDDLARFGFDVKIIHLPGHSNGSIGIVTGKGDLFCGDFVMNMNRVAPGFGIFDWKEFRENIDRLRKLDVKKIFPGHGKAFTMESLNGERFR